MARTPLSLAAFRVAYRAFIRGLVSRLGPELVARLLDSPLRLNVILGHEINVPKTDVTELIRKIPASRRDDFEDAAREVIRESLPDGVAVRDVMRAEQDMQAAEPAGVRPREWKRAKPPMRMGPPGGEAGPPDVPMAPIPMAPPPMEGGGLLGDDAHTGQMAAPPSFEPPGDDSGGEGDDDQPDEPRYLNTQIAGHVRDEPLTPKTDYVLEVFIGLQREGEASTQVPSAAVLFSKDEDTIELTVQVTSREFTVDQASLPLKLPRHGASKKARFDITPLAAGRGTLTISVSKNGNFLLQMEVSYSIGAAAAAEPTTQRVNGRAINSAEQLQKRELGLTITPALNGYDCEVRGATHTKVLLPLTEAELADAVKSARDALLAVIGMRDDKRALVFQSGITIDADSQAKALLLLARAGAALFRALFYGPKAGKDVRDIGDLIRRLATKQNRQLTLQVVAHQFPVPWGMLYMGSDAEGQVLDWNFFLGMRHVIEVIPLQTDMLVDDTVIVSDEPKLSVSVNVNAGIDAQMKTNVVARQVKYWNDGATTAGARLGLAQRSTRKEVLDALRGKSGDQLMYFYCHAVTNGVNDPGGIKGSYLVFTNDEHLSVDDLDREAPMRDALPGNPLVFINACESGELRPEFYDGFIPYFMAKGARGVVGTECKTPAIFATEWALEFFPRFLGGEKLGELFLDLRRNFTRQYGNPLGLVYAVYCDGDTQVQPGVTI